MFIPKSFHTYYAQEAVLHYLETGRRLTIPDEDVPEELRIQAACFVSIYEHGNMMRGCMGSIRPRHRWLMHEILDNAYFAAFEDKRFAEVVIEEMEGLVFKVETLAKPEPVRDLASIDPSLDGVIVRTPQGQEGLLLPATENINTPSEQIQLAMKKGGIAEDLRDSLEILRFRVQLFE
jgi:AmmeMemoRadiSam system protein A